MSAFLFLAGVGSLSRRAVGYRALFLVAALVTVSAFVFSLQSSDLRVRDLGALNLGALNA